MLDTSEIPRFRPLGPTETPFDNIALAFSGGGFRAAAYGLGVLSYFDHICYTDGDRTVPLRHHISYLSSASGGTIATAMYALNDAKGKSFNDYYKRLFTVLQGTYLLENTFKKLNDDKLWRGGAHDKRRNLINAFSLAYDEFLFEGALLSDLKPSPAGHLDEVCFNTTEFYKGLLFRQTAKMKADTQEEPGFLYGNFLVNLHRDTAGKIKLADILAASSCFPAGFEPIMFPDDFTYRHHSHGKHLSASTLRDAMSVIPQELSWPELTTLYGKHKVHRKVAELHQSQPGFTPEDLLTALQSEPLHQDFKIGMMDGGITDNQGLESMMKANDRRERGQTGFEPFDLMMVNDVGSHFIEPYMLAKNDKDRNKSRGTSIVSITLVAAACGMVGIWGMTYSMYHEDAESWPRLIAAGSTILLLISALILAGLTATVWFINGKLGKDSGLNLEKNFSPSISQMFFKYFGISPFIVLYSMVQERLNSVVLLNTDVFLKRIREILYQKFFDSENHLYRIKTNHIYDMSYSNDGNKEHHIEPQSGPPGRRLKTIAETAFNVGTTLWFDRVQQDHNAQAAVIASGQFTTCYNLLLYVETFKAGDIYQAYLPGNEYKARIDEMEAQLNEHYIRFNKDPFWLYNKTGQDAGIENFQLADEASFPFPAKFKDLRSYLVEGV
jgi:hypothetical protein